MLGDGTPRIAAGHNAVFWVDSETGETRPSTRGGRGAVSPGCANSLPDIDMIGIPVMPQDVPDPEGHAAVRRAGVHREQPQADLLLDRQCPGQPRLHRNAARPCFRGDLDAQVYGISQLSPTSPLFWEGPVWRRSWTRWRRERAAGHPARAERRRFGALHAGGAADHEQRRMPVGHGHDPVAEARRQGPLRQLMDDHRHAHRRGAGRLASRPASAASPGAQLARFYQRALPHHRAQLRQPRPRRAERLGEDLQPDDRRWAPATT